MDSYLQQIDQFIEKLPSKALKALDKISYTKRFKKDEFLLRHGQICQQSFLIKKGLARKYYLNDGKEITTEFLFPEDLAISFNSYCLGTPSKECIQALEDCEVSVTDHVGFTELKRRFPILVELDLMITEYYTMYMENRLFEFHTMDATQRYLLLLEQAPHLLQHVQLTHIASYLGISLETLSRIRAKISHR